jgi:tRNA (guanosine-2'-O-)-methyltransferase
MNQTSHLDRLPEDLRELAASLPPKRVVRALDLLDSRLDSVVLVAETIHRRHNVSAILRSAEAFGIHEAHLVTPAFELSKGAAKGAERWMDIQTHDDTTSCVLALKARGYRVYVADFLEGAVPPEDLPTDEPAAILVGGELVGVSDEARALADGAVCIPMRGVTQSLNVSVAAAIILRTVCEARRAAGGANGIHGEARHRFLLKFLHQERSRRAAFRALYES